MKRAVILVSLCALTVAVPAYGQYSLTNQGVSNITGTGARALGMGGAFIAIADDATAASWNPAGLAQLTRPEASLVYEYLDGTYDFASDVTTTATWDVYSIGLHEVLAFPAEFSDQGLSFASFTYPFQLWKRSFTVQAGYRVMASFPDLTRDANSEVRGFENGTEVYSYTTTTTLDDQFGGGFDAYSLSLSVEPVKNLRIGLSANYIDAEIKNAATEVVSDSDFPTDLMTEYYARYNFSDWQFDIGIQWDIGSHFTVGAVYHTGFTTDFELQDRFVYTYDEADWDWYTYFESGTEYATHTNSEVTWPDGWGVGLAWRPTDRLTFALDYGKTNWSKAKVTSVDVWIGTNPPQISSEQDKPFPYFTNEQNDTDTVRLGGEYLFMFSSGFLLPVRAGYFREKQLAVPSEMYSSPTSPEEGPVYTGYSLGIGFVIKRIQFDLAWVHTDGKTSQVVDDVYVFVLGEDAITSTISGPESVKIDSDRFLASLIVRF